MVKGDVVTGADETQSTDRTWRSMYIIGAIAAILALSGTIADIVITSIPGWEASTVPTSIVGWFAQFEANPLLGLRNLDLLNVVLAVIAVPMYVALFGVHRRVSQGLAALALVVVTLGTSVMVASNAALPMLDLSRQFSLATTDSQRIALQGAAQAILATGAHGSMGALAGFFLSSVGTLLMAVAMLVGGVFRRLASWTGIVGMSFLLAYVVGTAFSLAPTGVLMIVAMPGGLMMIAWYVMVARKLFRLTSTE
ncbi:MAG: hypothetical protein PF636_09670 [Actinomycetota bacterium]|jgi:hypothetical protein|nr:hypothetical protein [Actinomycetota bacterium]